MIFRSSCICLSCVVALIGCNKTKIQTNYSKEDVELYSKSVNRLGYEAKAIHGPRYGFYCNLSISDVSKVDQIPITQIPVTLLVSSCRIDRPTLVELSNRIGHERWRFSECTLDADAISFCMESAVEELSFEQCDCIGEVLTGGNEPSLMLEIDECTQNFTKSLNRLLTNFVNVKVSLADSDSVSIGKLAVTNSLEIKNGRVDFDEEFSSCTVAVLSLTKCRIQIDSFVNALLVKPMQQVRLDNCELESNPRDSGERFERLLSCSVRYIEVIGNEDLGRELRKLLPPSTSIVSDALSQKQ